MKKSVLLYTVLILTFLCMGVSFCSLMIKESNIVFLIPSIIGLVGTICFLYLLFVETVLGHKVYYYENGKLYVRQKKRVIDIIEKENVANITLIYDLFQGNLYMISFCYNNKKHYISINSGNEDNIMSFVEGKKYNIDKNYWYYLVEMFVV